MAEKWQDVFHHGKHAVPAEPENAAVDIRNEEKVSLMETAAATFHTDAINDF